MEKKEEILINLIWRFAERCGAQGVSFVVWLILARILQPEEFGTVTIINAMILILNVFVDSGLGSALIQKKDADDLDFSSVFYFNIAFGSALYAILFCMAPFIAYFYKNRLLKNLIRVAGISIIVSSVKNVQQAYVSRNMQFKKFFVATLSGTLLSAFLGIFMALKGYGAWAIVFQNIVNVILDTFILWIVVKWRPKPIFSINRLKQMLSYGWKILVSSLLDTLYNNARSLAIGKVYSADELAYYNKGNSIPNFIASNISFSLESVLFPVLSLQQESTDNIKNITRKAIKVGSYFIWPIMVGIVVTANSLIIVILTERWIKIVPYLCIFSFVYALWPIHVAHLNAIKALGRSDIFLKQEYIKMIIGVIALLGTLFISVEAVVIAEAIISVISVIINAWPNRRLINYKFSEQIMDVIPAMILSLIMGICVYSVRFFNIDSEILVLIIQIFIGISVYIGMSKLFHIESYAYLIDTIKHIMNNME